VSAQLSRAQQKIIQRMEVEVIRWRNGLVEGQNLEERSSNLYSFFYIISQPLLLTPRPVDKKVMPRDA
jgi:hypothetical protein